MRISTFRLLAVICVLVFLLGTPTSVDAGTLYVVGGYDNEFGTLDVATGKFQQIGILNLPSGDEIYSMGFTSNGTLYAIDAGIGPSYTTHLWRIDPTTALATDLGDTGQYLYAVAVRGNTVYALDITFQVNAFSTLYTVNPSNLDTKMIGPTSFETDGLMAFAPDGRLFAGENSYPGDNLYTVNLTTGASTYKGDMNHIMYTGTFIGNTLYTFNPANDLSAIFTVDTTTGVATQVGTYTLPNGDPIFASAYLPNPAVATPEPATFTLLGIGTFALLGYSWRRRKQVAI